jgi:hypothetical protein
VLLYRRELQSEGLVAVGSRKARIVESWGNGTNTEVGWWGITQYKRSTARGQQQHNTE